MASTSSDSDSESSVDDAGFQSSDVSESSSESSLDSCLTRLTLLLNRVLGRLDF